MKNPISVLSSFLILTLFTNCASSQFDKKPPFIIEKAQYQDWIGGKPGSKGTLVTIAFSEQTTDKIQFDSIFFNGIALPLKVDLIDDKTTISGNFGTFNSRDKMIIMDKDPKKEFRNKPPSLYKNLPFELAKNECVISYTFNNKKRYFKLDSLQKGASIIYP